MNSKKVVLFWGFEDFSRMALESYAHNYGFNGIYWISSNAESDLSIYALLSHFFLQRPSIDRLDRLYTRSDRFSSMLDTVTRIFLRHLKTWPNIKPSTIYDIRSFICMAARVIESIIVSRNISHIFFANLPHEGIDIVLADMCEAYGILSLSAYGMLPVDYLSQYIVNYRFGQKLILIDRRNSNAIRGLIIDSLKLYSELKRSLFNQYYMRDLKGQERSLSCEADASGMESIYFPLHLQPELTTETLCNPLQGDQLNLISMILEYTDSSIEVRIKRNPRIDDIGYSDEYILSILNNISRVKIFDSKHESCNLLRRSTYVATITGSIAYEAAFNSKIAFINGHPWYEGMPGIYQIDELFSAYKKNSYTPLNTHAINHYFAPANNEQIMSYCVDLSHTCYVGSALPLKDGGTIELLDSCVITGLSILTDISN